MKRYICLILTVTLLIGALASPVRASESSIHYADLLSAGYITHYGEDFGNMRIVSQGNGVVYFPIEVSYALGKCEILIYTNSPEVKLFGGSGYNLELTKTASPLGDKYYVFTGDLGGIGPRVYYTAPVGCYIYFMAAKAMPYGYDNKNCSFDVEVRYNADDSYVQNFVNRTSFSYEPYPQSQVHSFRIAPSADSIIGMDYIDVDLYVWNMRINSVSASIGGTALSVSNTTDFINSDGGPDNYYKINLRVDISGVSMVDGQMIIFIETQSGDGSSNDPYGEGFFHIFSIRSGLNFYTPDPEVSILTKIWRAIKDGFADISAWFEEQTKVIVDWFSAVLQGITDGFTSLETKLEELLGQDESESEEVSNDLADKGSQMEDMVDTMDSVVRPDTGDVSMDVDDYVSESDLTIAVAPLGSIFQTELFFSMIVMTLTMATVGYILYGKR